MRHHGGVHIGTFGGRELIDRGTGHLGIIAPTGGGKDQSIILKTMLDGWYGSTVSHDPKAELWRTVAKRRSRFAHQLLFDPTNPVSAGLNVLDWVRKDADGRPSIADIQNAIEVLMWKAKQDQWVLAAGEYMTAGSMHLLLAAPDSEKNFGGLRRFVARGDTGLYEMREAAVDPVCVRVAEQMLSVGAKGGDGEEQGANAYRGSVYNSAGVRLKLWDDRVVDRVTARSEFHLSDLMCAKNPVDLYLVNRPSDSERIQPLLRMIFVMLRRALMEEERTAGDHRVKNHRLLMVMNELLELKSGDEAVAMRSARSYGIKFLCAAQSLIDVEKELGTGLLNNCATRIFFRPNDDREAQRIALMMGETQVTTQNESRTYSSDGFFAKSRTVSPREESRPVLSPDEMMQWPTGKHAVILGHGKPILSDVKMAWADRRYAKLMAPPPKVRDDNGAYIDLPGEFTSPWLGKQVVPAPRPAPVEEAKKTAKPSRTAKPKAAASQGERIAI